MTFNITMKTPDCLDRAIEKATQDEDEQRRIKLLCSKWFTYGEYVTLIVDTEKNTCRVAGTPEVEKRFVVCYEGSPLIIIDNAEFALPHEVLNWYAEKYDFDRRKLTFTIVRHVTYEKSQSPS